MDWRFSLFLFRDFLVIDMFFLVVSLSGTQILYETDFRWWNIDEWKIRTFIDSLVMNVLASILELQYYQERERERFDSALKSCTEYVIFGSPLLWCSACSRIVHLHKQIYQERKHGASWHQFPEICPDSTSEERPANLFIAFPLEKTYFLLFIALCTCYSRIDPLFEFNMIKNKY